MSMKQLYFVKKGHLEWRDVKEPEISGPSQAIVRPFAAAKCDVDEVFLFSSFTSKLKIGNLLGLVDPDYLKYFGPGFFKGPFPFGHECVAEVLETGDKVTTFRPGDVVSVPFQISCGHCSTCTAGLTGYCQDTPAISTYGFGKHLQFGGALSDKLKVEYADGMLVKIPDGVDPVHLASLSDNIPDAYRHVGYELETNPDRSILVFGGTAKSIGLYTVLIAKAMGATRVDYVDCDHDRLALARKIGADTLYENFSQLQEKYDITVDAGVSEKGLHAAIRSLKPSGICSSSNIFVKKTHMPLVQLYVRGGTFRTGLANARTDAIKVLELLKSKALRFDQITTTLDTWENAIDAFLSRTSKAIVVRQRIFAA